MDKIFNLGFVFILAAAAIRYFISQEGGFIFLDLKSLLQWEVWLYGISVAWFILAFWNVLIRRRCPKCKVVKYSLNSSEEIDRWIGTKKVREKVGENSYGDRNVTTTFIKIKNIYKCLICSHMWSEMVKREKKI